jgi:pyruvate/2-oxoglutarate/acetoin dehydrogenase E1 component
VHIPGLKVVQPSTPYDAKGLLKSAIRDDNPVMFLEHKLLYPVQGPVPEKEYLIPLGQADIKRAGSDVTVVATSRMVHRSLGAAEKLAQEGIEVEIIDPRTLNPLDEETILTSVRKTQRLVVVYEAYERCGIGAEIAALVASRAIDSLDAPIERIAALNTPVPFSPKLENYVIPSEERIIAGIKRALGVAA